MNSILPEKYHRSIYIFALIVMVIGLSTSKFLMSVSQLLLAANWLIEGNVKNKFIAFWKNKPALIISSLLLLHFVGLLYTTDFNYAFKDIRIKSPLFILPVITSTSQPLSRKVFHIVLQFFVAAAVFASFVSTLLFFDIIYLAVKQTKGISIFISHINFSVLISVTVFIAAYFMYYSKKVLSKIIWAIIIVWMVYFLTLLGALTGVAVLALTSFLLIIYFFVNSASNFVKYAGWVIVIGITVTSVYYVNWVYTDISKKEIVDFKKLEKHTAHGNVYEHDSITKAYENGHLIWIYYSTYELEESWNKRSSIKIDSKKLMSNPIYNTLVRFLSSQGKRKDADAVNGLTNNEIKAIERGVVNVDYQNIGGLKTRIYETFWEIEVYKNMDDANGHSFTQRLEYWKTAIDIIKKYPIFGVGTGDVPKAFEQQYIKSNSSLAQEWRLRSHNQYLSFAVAFGLFGLLWFLITLIYPFLKLNSSFNYLYIAFFIISIISFFTDDMLETQAGVTFFAFINCFLLFGDAES